MKADTLTDVELLEAIELAATRARMAAAEDLRNVADMLAGLALEAAARLRDVLELTPSIDVAGAGRRVMEAIKAGDLEYGGPPTLEGKPGPLLGNVRNVVLHADGRLTADLTVNDAGAAFVERITGGPSRWACKRCGKPRRRSQCLSCGNDEPITDEPRVPGVIS